MWSVKQIVLDADKERKRAGIDIPADKQRKILKTHYITVKSGLSWQEAKALRNANRTLSIVKVRAALEGEL